ncbi:methionyl-tRNA formyltransferase [Marinobacterium alkalitolerans]|nr:formyltransferase family protein [Marinobacterium alkalitolerans]
MIKFGFYLSGEKGYKCLEDFVDAIGFSNVAYVCSSRDLNVMNDYYDDIKSLCERQSIYFYDRSDPVGLKVDYIVAIGWRWIIEGQEKIIVFHDSLLPKYRGFAPLVNALINGEDEVGVTVIKASSEYDAGPIIAQASMQVNYPIKIQDAIKKISKIYSELLLKISADLIKGFPIIEYNQNDLEASFSPWRNEDDYLINWHDCSKKIERFVDATGYPYAGAKTKIGSNFVRVEEVNIIEDVVVEDRKSHVGKVLFMDENKPVVICGNGLIKLNSFYDENGCSLVGKIPFRTKFGN